MPLTIYYDIRDDGLESTNSEHHFGLLARDYTDKPAMQAAQTLSAIGAGRALLGYGQTGLATEVSDRPDRAGWCGPPPTSTPGWC